MRRRSGQNFQELLNKEWSILSKSEHSEIQNLFKRTQQRNGGISFYDMINILRAIGLQINQEKKDEINKEIATKEIRVLDINIVLNQAAAIKKEKDQCVGGEVSQENEYLDAYVALGGSIDRSGYVSKSNLIETIKRQFQLTFDLESIIDGFQGESLDYTAFCSIFQQQKERGDGRLASAASQRSLGSADSQRSLVIDERDFQKFIAQYEGDENY